MLIEKLKLCIQNLSRGSSIMNKIIILIFIISNIFCENFFDQGVLEYNNRSIGFLEEGYVTQQQIDKAIKLFEQELNSEEENNIEQSVIYLLKSYYFKGEYVMKDIDSKKIIFDKGKKIAERYIPIYPESAAIRYWYLVNLGSWAESYGTLKAAREGVADIMKEQSEKIIALDLEYKNGGGYFMLGAVHLKSPYIPFLLSWPDKKEAIKYLQLAVDTKEATLVQKKYLAHAFYKIGSKEKAIEILNEVINSELSKDEIIEDINDIKKAKELLKTF